MALREEGRGYLPEGLWDSPVIHSRADWAKIC